jgi:hypothetical protein
LTEAIKSSLVCFGWDKATIFFSQVPSIVIVDVDVAVDDDVVVNDDVDGGSGGTVLVLGSNENQVAIAYLSR